MYVTVFPIVWGGGGGGGDGKTASKSGLAFNGISHYGKLRTERSGGSWL